MLRDKILVYNFFFSFSLLFSFSIYFIGISSCPGDHNKWKEHAKERETEDEQEIIKWTAVHRNCKIPYCWTNCKNVMFFVYPFIACLMFAFRSKNLSNILFLVFSSILTYRGICGTVFLFHIFLWVLHFFIIYKAATDTVLLLTVIFRSQIKTNQWQNTTEKNHIVDYHTMWYYS